MLLLTQFCVPIIYSHLILDSKLISKFVKVVVTDTYWQKIRTSSHTLEIDRGRITNTEANERLCAYCERIDDERQFILYCDAIDFKRSVCSRK